MQAEPRRDRASTTANYCSAETNTVEVHWKRRQSLLLAGKVVLRVREAEGGEEGGLDTLTQAGLLGLAVQAGHSVIYRGGMQHAAAGANYRAFISLSPFQTVSQPTKTSRLPHCSAVNCNLQTKCRSAHTHTHKDRCLDNIYDSGDYTRYKTHKKVY